jgi:hypothetical protein
MCLICVVDEVNGGRWLVADMWNESSAVDGIALVKHSFKILFFIV